MSKNKQRCYACGCYIDMGKTINLKFSQVIKRDVCSRGWFYMQKDKQGNLNTVYREPKITSELARTTLNSYSLCEKCAEKIKKLIEEQRKQ